MIQTIEIIINEGINIKLNLLISVENKNCYFNDIQYDITNEKIDKLLDILSTWKYEYGSSNIIDAQEFKVIVKTNNGVTNYHGNGIYPNNYNEFLDVLGDIQNGN